MDGFLTDEERRELLELLDRSEGELLELTRGLDERSLTQRPPEGGWCLVELVEHLIKAENSLMKAVRATLETPANPDWRQETEGSQSRMIRLLSNRQTKAPAPDHLRPSGDRSPERILSLFRRTRSRSRSFAKSADGPLKQHTRPHSFPVFGVLNAYQWLLYIGYHQLRHNRQAEEILHSIQQ